MIMSGDDSRFQFLMQNIRDVNGQSKISLAGHSTFHVDEIDRSVDLRFVINDSGMFPLFVATFMGQ